MFISLFSTTRVKVSSLPFRAFRCWLVDGCWHFTILAVVVTTAEEHLLPRSQLLAKEGGTVFLLLPEVCQSL